MLGCVVFRTFFQIMLLISPVDPLYAPSSHTKFQYNPIIFNPPLPPFMFTYVFNGLNGSFWPFGPTGQTMRLLIFSSF